MDFVSIRIITGGVARLVGPAGSARTARCPPPGANRPADNHTVIIEFLVDDVDSVRQNLAAFVEDFVYEPATMPWVNRSLLFRGAATYNFLNADQDLNIPVYVVAGGHDEFFCGLGAADCTSASKLAAHERAWYGPRAAVSAYVVPDAGHDLQLERGSSGTTAHMLAFAARYIGHGSGQAGTAPGGVPPVPGPPPGRYSVLDAAAQAAFEKLARPAVDAYTSAINPIPGLGTTANPVEALDQLLPVIANADGEVLATLPHRVMGAT